MQCMPNGKIFQYEIGKEYKEVKLFYVVVVFMLVRTLSMF